MSGSWVEERRDVRWLVGRIIDPRAEGPAPRPIGRGEDLVDLLERPSGLPLGKVTSQVLSRPDRQ